MQTTTTEPTLIDKHQAAKRLGMHWRSILLFAKNGTLKSTRVRDPKTNHVTTKFAEEDVERLKKERASPAINLPAVSVSERPAMQEKQGLQTRIEPNLGALLAALADRPERTAKPFLTMQEAVEYTGFPMRGVEDLRRSGKLPYFDFGKGTRGGRYRFKRADLDALQGGTA